MAKPVSRRVNRHALQKARELERKGHPWRVATRKARGHEARRVKRHKDR